MIYFNLVSIIITAYNVEEYISECLNSVLEQSYYNFECIVVDDGSSDRTGEIADRYAANDLRIKVIHKENGGAADARNTGLQLSQGNYVTFLDGDDFYMNKDSINFLVDLMRKQNADIVQFGIMKARDYRAIPKIPPARRMTVVKFDGATELENEKLHPSACNKLFKRNLLFENELVKFESGKTCEDIAWTAEVISRSSSMVFIDCKLYGYRQRVGSISKEITQKNCSDLLDALFKTRSILEEQTGEKRRLLKEYLGYQAATFYLNQAKTQVTPYSLISTFTPLVDFIIANTTDIKVKILKIVLLVFGHENTCKIIRTLRGRHRGSINSVYTNL